MNRKTEVMQGTLGLMVLKTLETMGPLHGYGIARRIEQISGNVLSLNYGTIYPALLKLEQEGCISSEWGVRTITEKQSITGSPEEDGSSSRRVQRAGNRRNRFSTASGARRGSAMRHLRAWIVRLCGLFTGERQDRKFAEEIESHLAMHIEDNLRSGMNPEEARRNAIIKLGGIDKTFETYRDRSRLPFVFDMVRNFRHASRSLIQTPIFTLVVVSTLALGIGANTAIFSAMHQLLLGSLPIENPEELAFVTTSKAPKVGSVWGTDSGGADYLFSYPAFRDLERQQQENLAELAGFRYTNTIVSHQNQAAQCRILMVSGRYFSVVRFAPFWVGRFFRLMMKGTAAP